MADLLFKPSDPVAKEFYMELPVNIVVEGSYHGMHGLSNWFSHQPDPRLIDVPCYIVDDILSTTQEIDREKIWNVCGVLVEPFQSTHGTHEILDINVLNDGKT